MTFIIIRTNCDCSSDIIARTLSEIKRWLTGCPRCPNCHKQLGIMEWREVKTVKAKDRWEARRLYFSKGKR